LPASEAGGPSPANAPRLARRAAIETRDPYAAYRPWFLAAAAYNFAWGSINILFPAAIFDLLGLERPNYLPLWQVVGMFVLVYAPAYWWASRDPAGFPHLIVIGLAGKVLGPIGFLWSALTGGIPWVFGLTIVTNDLVWYPSFARYLRLAARERGGWRALLVGR
jgi:hypothetical protein